MLPVLPASSPIIQDALCAQFIGNLNHTLIPDATLFPISYTPVRVPFTRHSRHRTRLLKQRFGPHVLERPSSFTRKSKGVKFNKSHSFQTSFLLVCPRNQFQQRETNSCKRNRSKRVAGPGEFLNDKDGPIKIMHHTEHRAPYTLV
jgi:hypothetical protein